MNAHLKRIISEVINDFINNLKFEKIIEDDGDRIIITAYYNDENIGQIISNILFDSYSYEFDDVFNEDEFYEIYPDDHVIKIEHIEIDDYYKGSGVGTALMNRMMKIMKNEGYNQFYLNASPMGFSGLDLSNLIKFYEKFGFKVLKHQGNNAIMGVVF